MKHSKFVFYPFICFLSANTAKQKLNAFLLQIIDIDLCHTV